MNIISNYLVARVFMDIAEALEFRGQHPYRVRANQNAARTILQLGEAISEIYRRGALLSLPGIGKSLSAKIGALLESGHLRKHDTLMREFPPGVAVLCQPERVQHQRAGHFQHGTGERIGGNDEEGIYAPLGIRINLPELREDRGEIEPGLDGIVPDFVTADALRGDLGVHSTWSVGHASIRSMALAAREVGFDYLAITDHSPGRGAANGLSLDGLREQRREIRKLNAEIGGITILAGCEVDIRRDGSLDFPDDALDELDLCIASVHSAFSLPEAAQTARLIAAMHNPFVDIVAHPTGRLIEVRDSINLNMTAILQAAAPRGVLLEVNSWPECLDLSDTDILSARSAGVHLVIDSDAHAPDLLRNHYFGVATARRNRVFPNDILNTLTLKQLLPRLRRHLLHRAA